MTTSIARVYVNKIEVGTLPADQCQQIVKAARADWLLYLAFAWSSLVFVGRVIYRWLRFVALFWACAAVLVAALIPAWVTEAIESLRTAMPAAISEGISYALFVSLFLVAVVWFVALFDGAAFGPRFISPFDKRINHDVRKLLEVPAEGNIQVVMLSSADDEQ